MSDPIVMSEEEQDAFLAHYGVKGMKWGKRNLTTTDIKSARARDASRVHQLNNQIAKTNLATGSNLKREAKTLEKMSVDYLKSPDRADAMRLTRGEKAALAVLAIAIPGPGTAAAAGAAGGRLIVRKSFEKQARQLKDQ